MRVEDREIPRGVVNLGRDVLSNKYKISPRNFMICTCIPYTNGDYSLAYVERHSGRNCFLKVTAKEIKEYGKKISNQMASAGHEKT